MEIIQVDKFLRLDLPLEEFNIMPVGDLQLGGDGYDSDLFKRDIDRGMKANAMFIGMGDYIDVMSPSNRSRFRSADLYDSAYQAMEDRAEELRQDFMKLVKGTEGHWLGLHEGHHYYEYADGETTDYKIAQDLGTTPLGTTAITMLAFKHGKSTRRYTIWSSHGSGSSTKQSGPINKLENVANGWETIDCFMMGHYSRKPHVPISRLYPTHKPPYKLKERRVDLIATGGYMKGYEVGSRQGKMPRGSYVEKAMMTPVTLGCPLVHIRPVRRGSWSRSVELDVTVEV